MRGRLARHGDGPRARDDPLPRRHAAARAGAGSRATGGSCRRTSPQPPSQPGRARGHRGRPGRSPAGVAPDPGVRHITGMARSRD
ncbi:MAG: hypothetical protein FJW99_02855 [Actinobacteria bacterium]|nr:hypothetical protein [Actinomycetota bacterium]